MERSRVSSQMKTYFHSRLWDFQQHNMSVAVNTTVSNKILPHGEGEGLGSVPPLSKQAFAIPSDEHWLPTTLTGSAFYLFNFSDIVCIINEHFFRIVSRNFWHKFDGFGVIRNHWSPHMLNLWLSQLKFIYVGVYSL